MKPALLLLLAFPLLWPWIARHIWSHKITWKEMGLNVMISTTLIIGLYYIAAAGKTWDIEIWNGEIISKHRDHGSYIRTYECNCYTDDKGNRHCSTCYEHHYTVDWYLKSNIGTIGIDHEDWTTTAVYSLPDPRAYVEAYVGEPCSIENSYVNYVKAVPESLFHLEDGSTAGMFKDLYTYPRVRSYYKVDRVLSDGTIGDLSKWNNYLAEKLKTLGPRKQANIILIFTRSNNPTFRHAMEEHWLGGKKNDIVVFLGVPAYPRVAWVDVMTFGANAGNALFVVELRNELAKLPLATDHVKVIDLIADKTEKLFVRKSMTDYEYLKSEIIPATWVLILLAFIGIGSSLGLSYLFFNQDIFET